MRTLPFFYLFPFPLLQLLPLPAFAASPARPATPPVPPAASAPPVAASAPEAAAPVLASAPEAAALPPTEMLTLANGLRVLLAPDPTASLASIQVTYRAGLGDDPTGLRGLAHITEHLVAERTKHVPSGLSALESWGATHFNASTSLDHTEYYETVPPNRIEAALWLESDRMGFASEALSQARLESARAAVKNEGVQHSDGGYDLSARIRAELFPSGHPYADADGALDVDDVTLADVRAFLATWYLPSNATLAVAGRFDRDAVVAAIQRYFDPVPSGRAPERPSPAEMKAPSVRLIMNMPRTTSLVSVGWTTPAYGTKDDAALDLFATALAGAGNARLTGALIAPGFARSFSARQVSNALGSTFLVTANVAPNADPRRVAEILVATVEDFAMAPRPGEIARAREIYVRNADRSLETPWVRASRMSTMATIGHFPGRSFDWGTERYQGLTDRDIKSAAMEWLAAGRHVVAIVVPDPAAPTRGTLVRREDLATRDYTGETP